MKTVIFLLSSKEEFGNLIELIRSYGYSINVLLLSGDDIKIEEMKKTKNLLIFTDLVIDSSCCEGNIISLKGLTVSDLINEINACSVTA